MRVSVSEVSGLAISYVLEINFVEEVVLLALMNGDRYRLFGENLNFIGYTRKISART